MDKQFYIQNLEMKILKFGDNKESSFIFTTSRFITAEILEPVQNADGITSKDPNPLAHLRIYCYIGKLHYLFAIFVSLCSKSGYVLRFYHADQLN